MAASLTPLCILTPNHWSGSKGGAEYQIECLVEALVPLGKYEIYYIARCAESDFRASGYSVIRIGTSNRIPRMGLIFDAIPLLKVLRGIRPAVIYQRVACGYTGIAAYYARSSGARLVWHIAHDTDVIPGQSLDVGRNVVRTFLEKRSVEFGIRNATAIVAQTQDQSSLLEKNYRRKADVVIPNFHPLAVEKIDKSGAINVLWVANLKPWKQPEIFVRLARRLKDLHGVRFLMVGAESAGAGDRSWLNSVLSDVQQTANLEYLGERSQDEVNALLARSHVFVNTSVQEGFPNTFIQAWMREVPVVSLHVNPENVLEEAGVGIYAGSEERLAHATRRLIENQDERESYAKRSRLHAMNRHSLRNAELLANYLESDTAATGRS